jgi:WYL domain
MGNSTNKDQWAARERMTFIERLAWWCGVVNRGDVRDIFGISAAQVTADLQAYQEQNPGVLHYNVRAKRYEAQPGMACILHQPRLEEAVQLFLGEKVMPWAQAHGTPESSVQVALFQPLERRASAEIERRVFLALKQGLKLKIRYWSVKSARDQWRDIIPHALGHDGYRWHARAWCCENQDFRDFVLSRIESAEWPTEKSPLPARDEDWEKLDTIVLRANHTLKPAQRTAIERDYAMTHGELQVPVRRAMREYFFAHWKITATPDEDRPQHLQLSAIIQS